MKIYFSGEKLDIRITNDADKTIYSVEANNLAIKMDINGFIEAVDNFQQEFLTKMEGSPQQD